jgi:hypothetical protein
MSSPTKSLGLCHLIRPSPETPWSVDVVSAIPKDVMTGAAGSLRQNYVVGTCLSGRWSCVGTNNSTNNSSSISSSSGQTLSQRCTFHVWNTPPNTPLEDQKHKLPVLKLSHAKIEVGAEDGTVTVPLLAMEVSPQSPDIVYIYALQPTTGVLVLWKLSVKDLSKPLAPPAKFVLFLDLLDNEKVTSLTVHWKHASPMILVGTDQGRVIWVMQTHVPIALHAQTADPSQTGLLTRIWKTVQYHETTPVVAALGIAEKEFFSVSYAGKIVHWKVTSSEAHKAYFQAEEKCQLLLALRAHLGSSEPALYDLQVKQAALQADGSALHVLVLTLHADDESRLYWTRLAVDHDNSCSLELQHAVWLNRFVSPESVAVAGWLVADNSVAYGAFCQDPSLPAIIMALDLSGQAHEVDLPVDQVQSVLKDTLSKDVVTHGCSVLTESGMGLRVRVTTDQAAAARMTNTKSSNSSSNSSSNPATVITLTSHLRSVFWEFYQNPDRTMRMPPSLAAATSADLEQAVIAVALLLKDKGDVSSMQNPTEWHMAFISLLQQQGFYRSLSVKCRWFLLGIGQELAVFWWLVSSMSKKTVWQQEQLGKLLPQNTAEWLERVQTSVLAEGGGEDRQEEWVQWLCTALESATQFREDNASFTYDVSADLPPQSPDDSDTAAPIWTSRPAMQRVLERQLLHWKANPVTTRTSNVETVVQIALQSFGDSYAANSDTKAFKAILKLAIPFLRSVKGVDNDQLAFTLSKTHKYFSGLCQIVLDHETMNDTDNYALDALFQQLAKKRDVETNMLFGEFVLKWHTERELFGHVLNYGKHCPHVLNQFLQNEEALRPYRWIQAIRQGDYNVATESLMSNVETGDPTLAEAKFALSLGKIANKVVETESRTNGDTVMARRRRIDKTRELVNAQEELFGKSAAKSRLWEPSHLVDYALDQLKDVDAEDKAEKIRVCFIGLAICASFESDEDCRNHAARVWWSVLMADGGLWAEWLRTENNLANTDLLNDVLQITVFGGLVQQADEVESWSEVVYGPKIERQVMEKVTSLDSSSATGMRRLLRSMTPGRW